METLVKPFLKVLAITMSMYLALAGCGSRPRAGPNDARLRIVTTVAPITNIVSNVVGDLAEVTGVIPEGANSHTFEPAPSVAEVLSTADVIFMNGLQLEEPMRRLAEENLKAGTKVVLLGELTLQPSNYLYDFSFPPERGKPNPHLWTDPTLVRRYAQIVKDVVVRRDPARAEGYERNLESFIGRIDELDLAMRTSSATLPPERRKLLTYHDAYGYFARTYGWTVIGAIQLSDLSEPRPKEVAALIEQVRNESVPAIFGSEVFPSPVLEQIGKEAGARYVDALRDDDLPGSPGAPEHSWLGLMQFNFVTMVESLGGDASALRAFKAENVAADVAEYPQ